MGRAVTSMAAAVYSAHKQSWNCFSIHCPHGTLTREAARATDRSRLQGKEAN